MGGGRVTWFEFVLTISGSPSSHPPPLVLTGVGVLGHWVYQEPVVVAPAAESLPDVAQVAEETVESLAMKIDAPAKDRLVTHGRRTG